MRVRQPRAGPQLSPYNEASYRAERARIALEGPPCWRRCGRVATTPDHVPALARHDHVPGSGCCVLLPACEPCQYGHGARIANQRRNQRRPCYAIRRW